MPGARRLEGQHKREWKLAAVVALQLADPERQRRRELAEERQARVLVKASVEAQLPEAGAVIERRVLKRPATGDFDKLHVDLDALAGLGLFRRASSAVVLASGSVAGAACRGPERSWPGARLA